MAKINMKSKQKMLAALAMGALMSASVVIAPNAQLLANAEVASVTMYKTEYGNVTEVLDEIYTLNEQVAAEGFVLLKNEQNNLPFAKNVKNISVFGRNSNDPVYSGSGSSGGTSGKMVTLEDGLKRAGFNLNPTLIDFYSAQSKKSKTNYGSYWFTGETPIEDYTDAVKDSYANYNDAAVVVFSRTGGEGSDLPTASLVREKDAGTKSAKNNGYPTRTEKEEGTFTPYGGEGRENTPYDHYLTLDENETALLEEVTEKFDKVVVVLNSVQTMELSEEFMNNDKIQSVIWAPGPGPNGFMALGKILKGEVNPSGRTSDTFSADFTKDPTWKNFGNNGVGLYSAGDAGNAYTLEDGTLYTNNFSNNVYEVSYEEGIYLGYKYYETRGYTDGEEWYDAAVNYPFGYGLSYTDFEWEVGEVKMDTATLTAATKISVDVKVTNTGDVAGKDVVQAYFSAPYAAGKTEKSHVVLAGFEKTSELKPGASETVTVTFEGFDMASFDAYDKDGDSHKGYELDKGDYTLYVGKNAHDAWANNEGKKIATLGADLNVDEDPTSGADIAPHFEENTEEMKDRVLSRNDWEGTFPTTPSWYGDGAELVKSEEWLANFDMPIDEAKGTGNAVVQTWYDEENPRYDGEEAPWYAETAPTFRAEDQAYSAENPAPIQLKDMVGVGYNDVKWNEFLSQLTIDQTYAVMETTRFQFNAVDALGAPMAGHSDGPQGISGPWVGGGNNIIRTLGTSSWGVETLIACTWNKDIAYDQGRLTGEYGLWAKTVGWYAPGANIHRSPFSGRNFEYYSEDATLSGYMLENVVAGARSKGMVTFMKHFVLNDQESNRDTNGVATWADEQTMRENYFKPFEWAIKNADANGLMSSFNRLGFDWAGGNYALLTELVRGEWGFEGVIITDAHMGGYGCMLAGQMVRAGNDMSLDSSTGSIARIVNSDEANTPTQLTAVRNAVKNILYVQLNSAAMAGTYYGTTLKYDATGLELNKTYAAGTTFGGRRGEVLSVADLSDATSKYVIVQGNLPEGVSMTAEGSLSGTISSTAAGVYSVKIAKLYTEEAGLEYINSMTKSAGNNGYKTLTIIVPGIAKTDVIGNTDYYTVYANDGSQFSFTVTNGVDGMDGIDGINGTNGTNGTNGENGKDGVTPTIEISDDGYWVINGEKTTHKAVAESTGFGCGSSLAGSALAVFAMITVLGGVVVARKRD